MAEYKPSTPVDICNLAFDHLNAKAINNMAGTEQNEILARRHYDSSRRALLRRHAWNFAKTDTLVNKLSGYVQTTGSYYADAYLLPADYLRLISVGDVFIGTKKIKYDIRSYHITDSWKKCLLLNNKGATNQDIVYTRNILSVNLMDPLFIELLALELAIKMANKLTGKPSVKDRLERERDLLRVEAFGADGQERPPVVIENSKFLNARQQRHNSARNIITEF